MRVFALLLGCAVLILCHLKATEAVVCESPGVPDNCVDCSDEENKDEPDCTTTTTTTTTSTTTTTTTTAAPTTIVDAPPNRNGKPRRKRIRVTNMRYRNTRHIRVKRQGRPAGAVRQRTPRAVRVSVG